MIFILPLISWKEIHLIGPLNIQVWGLFVSLGFLAGIYVAVWFAKKRKLIVEHIYNLALWIMIGSFIGARVLYLFEAPGYFISYPLEIFKLWNGGFSVMGGFMGAAIVAVVYIRNAKIHFWSYADVAVFGLPIGLCIGRIGCSLIHDHLGKECNFPWCVDFYGVIRHEPAYYLSLSGLVLFLVFLAFRNAKIAKTQGFFVSLFMIWYGISRFFLDFTRDQNIDQHFFGLSFAQYFSVAMLIGGIILAWKRKKFFSSKI